MSISFVELDDDETSAASIGGSAACIVVVGNAICGKIAAGVVITGFAEIVAKVSLLFNCGFSCKPPRRARLTNKQGPGVLGARLRSSEPRPHPHANKPTLTLEASPAEASDPCKLERRRREYGDVSGPRKPHGSPSGQTP